MIWYRFTGGFQCNSSGNGSESKIPSTGHWAAIWVTAYATDFSGTWFTGDQGHPYLQNGASAVMGPVILMPGQTMVTSVEAATPGVETTIEYRGWFSDTTDGSDLTAVVGSEITAGSVTLPTPVPVSDGGLAGSVATKLSQFALLDSLALTSGGTATFTAGVGGTAYPAQAASWQIVINGMQASTSSLRIVTTKQDGAGNSLGYVQRDTAAAGTLDRIVASGILDAPTTVWQITLESGAPAGCIANIYTTASLIQDNFYDSGIYENTSAQAGFFSPGYDGILATVTNTILASGNQTYALPTYRGPAQLGVELTQAGHLSIQEQTYLAGGISNKTSIPVSSSGLAQQIFIVFLGGFSNSIVVFNDDSGASNTFFLEVRAIKDLLD